MQQGETIAGVPQRTPQDAWDALAAGRAILVDVRSRAEWTFVGLPDLSSLGAEPVLVEWQVWPGMGRNPQFEEAMAGALAGGAPAEVLFLCRSGGRSQAAAMACRAAFEAAGIDTVCSNVVEGFEGDPDAEAHRGSTNGWKARGLPWRQS